ncbi:hypothetical protein BALOs_0778 [Halobacteriovorax sp. BALOs_7]|nr:hypothetical protein [Halobacteriovorax sp. BALOs_7]AYF43788.1 hypothetical protein BALOs_0778 [Halobacteriovorax sp. BALOs_7]
MYKEYKVETISEGGLVGFQVIEKKRFLLFWQRETVILSVGR